MPPSSFIAPTLAMENRWQTNRLPRTPPPLSTPQESVLFNLNTQSIPIPQLFEFSGEPPAPMDIGLPEQLLSHIEEEMERT